MGAVHSAFTPLTTRMEPERIPREIEPPTLMQSETVEQKVYRKFTSQPLVPIGCMVTVYYLASGIKSFYNRDANRSQKMMRARVAAQFVTLLIFVGYTGLDKFDFTIAPMYQRSKEKKEGTQSERDQPKEETE